MPTTSYNHNQSCGFPQANNYRMATAKSSAFPGSQEKKEIEVRMKAYRKRRQEEINKEIVIVKKRISSLYNSKKSFKIKGKKVIALANY